MKKILCVLTLALMVVTAAVAQDVIGKWKLEDGSAIVEIYKQDEVYNGRIVWLNEPNGPDGKPALDVNNPDKSLRSRKLMGLNMLHGLKPANGEYSGGKIYDPGNGKTYNCSMKVEGKVLKVRGSLDKKGMLGRTMDWFRVVED